MFAGVLIGGAAAGRGTGQRAQRGGHLGRGVRISRVPSEQTSQDRCASGFALELTANTLARELIYLVVFI